MMSLSLCSANMAIVQNVLTWQRFESSGFRIVPTESPQITLPPLLSALRVSLTPSAHVLGVAVPAATLPGHSGLTARASFDCSTANISVKRLRLFFEQAEQFEVVPFCDLIIRSIFHDWDSLTFVGYQFCCYKSPYLRILSSTSGRSNSSIIFRNAAMPLAMGTGDTRFT